MSTSKVPEISADQFSTVSIQLQLEQKVYGMHYSLAQTFLDQEISKLYESFRALKTLRNELSPVSRLPPELLCRIFKFVQTPGEGESGFEDNYQLRWIKVAHVSRKWMDVALSNPSLWSEVVVDGNCPTWEREAIKRAQDIPLTILAFVTPESQKEIEATFKHSLFPRLWNVKNLTISGEDCATLSSLLSKIPSTPFSLLQSLHLSLAKFESTTLTVPQVLWADAPLQSLYLNRFTVDWEWPLFGGLVRLTLAGIPTAQRPRLTDIFLALQKATRLESLTLLNSLPTSVEYSTSFTASQVINLPRLAALYLGSTANEVSDFLPHLKFPDDTIIKINCESPVTREQLSIFSNLGWPSTPKEVGSHGPDKTIQYLRIKVVNDHWVQGVSIDAWQKVNFPQSRVKIPENDSDIEVVFDFDVNYGFDLLQTLRGLFIKNLQWLCVSGVSIESESWKTTFGNLTSLSYIHLEETTSSVGLADALVSLCSSSRLDNSGTTVLPSLRHISIEGIHFVGVDYSEPFRTRLEKCLRKRREEKAPIHTLTVNNCYDVKLDDVEKLRQVVNVEWDQKLLESGFDDW